MKITTLFKTAFFVTLLTVFISCKNGAEATDADANVDSTETMGNDTQGMDNTMPATDTDTITSDPSNGTETMPSGNGYGTGTGDGSGSTGSGSGTGNGGSGTSTNTP